MNCHFKGDLGIPFWYNPRSMIGIGVLTDDSVARAASGDREALSRLVEVLYPQIRLMVVVRLAPTPVQLDFVDDLVQEVSKALAQGIRGLRRPTVDGLRAFLSGITAKQVALFLRKKVGHKSADPPIQSLDSIVDAGSNMDPLQEFLYSSGTSPISAADRADRVAQVLRELGALKNRYRQVITLAFFDQLVPGEIGARMGLSREAASKLLLRAVETLRRRVTAGKLQEVTASVQR